MRRINLLPSAQRRGGGPGLAGHLRLLTQLPPKTWTAVIAALGILITLLMAYSVGTAKASVDRQLRTAQAQLDSLRPVVQEVEDLQRLKATLDSKMEVIDRLVIGRMSWAKKLHEIATLMSRNEEIARNVWLTSINLVERREMEDRPEVRVDKDGKRTTVTTKVPAIYRVIEMTGRLPGRVSTGMVSDIMKMMKEDAVFFKDFTKVQLDYIQDAPGAQKGEGEKAFKISLYMKPPGSRR